MPKICRLVHVAGYDSAGSARGSGTEVPPSQKYKREVG